MTAAQYRSPEVGIHRRAEASPHFFARFQRVHSPGAWKGAGNPREALPSQGCRKVTPTTGSGALRRQGFARVARAFPGAGRGSNAENSRRKNEGMRAPVKTGRRKLVSTKRKHRRIEQVQPWEESNPRKSSPCTYAGDCVGEA